MQSRLHFEIVISDLQSVSRSLGNAAQRVAGMGTTPSFDGEDMITAVGNHEQAHVLI